ncbi:DUF418 domain-containing protein [Pseudonocardia endophytica]|uniref:Putative membrane protein YeiB n=1 Tax=Pseudonocardia endophytica TaxID=401976 RepID=A0A4R1HHS1_PSEEN|nr:DUF418 domain-containing protein [Pseudonocardia endophytica]TCK21777.1 putative membrane protein YeiB [Pseudonocardia endophytica]
MPAPLSAAHSAVPTAQAERALAPDLARGVMLLFIALAHTRLLHIGGSALSVPAGGGPLDVVAQALTTTFVDSRAYPLFAVLFGYGLAQIARRSAERGIDGGGIRSLLRRRGAWMVVFGLVHVVLLYAGDVIGVYGLVAVLFAGAVAWSGRRLWWGIAVGTTVGALLYGGMQLVLTLGGTLELSPNPLVNAADRVLSAVPLLPVSVLSAVGPVLLGIWAGRARLLEFPGRHRALLRRTAWIGLPVTVLGALPVTLQAVGLWSPASPTVGFGAGALHNLTGVAGGLAYAAVLALVAQRIGDRRGPVTTALAACGQRSMTCYLAQSVVWLVATEPLLFDVGNDLGVAAAAGVGVATWLVTVVAADLLRRAGLPGPFEALLRRLTYRAPRPTRPGPGSRSAAA